MSKFLKNTSIIFGSQSICQVFSLFFAVLTARLLGPAGKGMLSLALLVPNLIVLISNLGVEISNTYFIGKKKYKTQDIISNSVFLSLVIGLSFVVLIWLFAPIISRVLIKGIQIPLLRLSVCLIPLGLMNRYFISILLGQNRIKQLSALRILETFSALILTILLLVVFKFEVFGALVAVICATFLSVIVGVFYVKDGVYQVIPKVNKPVLFQTIRHGVKGYIGNLLQFFNYRFDVILVNFFLGVVSVGHYTIAVALAEFVWHIPNAIAQTLFPKIASSTREQANQFTPMVFRHTFLVTLLAACVLFSVSRFVIPVVFGKAYIPSIVPLWILLPGIVMLSLSKVLTGDLNGRGLPQYGSYSSAISLVATLSLDFFLIPKMGIAGAALASSISYSIATMVVLIFFIKISGLNFLEMFRFNASDFNIYKDLFYKFVRIRKQQPSL